MQYLVDSINLSDGQLYIACYCEISIKDVEKLHNNIVHNIITLS